MIGAFMIWITVMMNYCDVEFYTDGFALEMNQDCSAFSEIAPKYFILNFVDCEGYSISSKGFLPTVVDIMSSELNLSFLSILVH